jgi:hypothetical protein
MLLLILIKKLAFLKISFSTITKIISGYLAKIFKEIKMGRNNWINA